MKRTHLPGSAAAAALFVMTGVQVVRPPSTDPLPSWNDGPSNRAIVEFGRRARSMKPSNAAGSSRHEAGMEGDLHA